MKVVTFCAQKGGSGKTTLCFSLGVAALQAGVKVHLLDLDPQHSLSDWYKDRDDEAPAVDVLPSDRLAEGLAHLRKQGVELVLIDTAGKADPATAAAITQADLCIVPSRPTPGDLKAVRPTAAMIQKAGKDAAYVITQTPPRSYRIAEASKALSILGMVAPQNIVQRNDHQDAQGAGLGVTEFAPDGKAAGEIQALWQWIESKLRKVGNDSEKAA